MRGRSKLLVVAVTGFALVAVAGPVSASAANATTCTGTLAPGS
jgi:hypothetical protein